jgi:S1-C subfamily serine protease
LFLERDAVEGTSLDKLLNNSSKNLSKNDNKDEAVFTELGLTVENLNSDELKALNAKNGVVIKQVERYSAAEDQGLRIGFVISQVDRVKINSVSDLKKAFESKKGNAVLLKVADRTGTSRFIGLEIPNK